MTDELVMNWGKKILDEMINFNDISFVKITMDKGSGEILRFKG
jgi:hypothetical protein